jgi:hypothetical protein
MFRSHRAGCAVMIQILQSLRSYGAEHAVPKAEKRFSKEPHNKKIPIYLIIRKI